MRNEDQKSLEIDLKAIAKSLWFGRKIILISICACLALGVFIALFSPVQYESHCTLVAEGRQNSSGSLRKVGGLLSSLTGVNLDMSGSSSITPEFYPYIAASTPFLLEILEKPVYYRSLNDTISTQVYFEEFAPSSPVSKVKEYTIGLPGKLKALLQSESEQGSMNEMGESQVLQLSRKQHDLVEALRNRLNVSADLKTGIVTISCEMPDPTASANITYQAMELLKNYIMRQQQLKASSELSFIQKNHADADTAFQKAQEELALFKDRNQFMSNDRSQIELRRLEAQYSIAFDLFSSLSAKLMEAQIKVKENTPVFAVINQPTVPISKSKPKRKIIVIISVILGGFLGLGLVIAREFFSFLRKYNISDIIKS